MFLNKLTIYFKEETQYGFFFYFYIFLYFHHLLDKAFITVNNRQLFYLINYHNDLKPLKSTLDKSYKIKYGEKDQVKIQ